jgi:hypothetical protein
VVRKVDKIHVPIGIGTEIDNISEDLLYIRDEQPPDEAELLRMFRRWCLNSKGTFDDVLKEWVKDRLELRLPVNPGPIDPNEPPKRRPARAFRIALQGVFNAVKAEKAKTRKPKK